MHFLEPPSMGYGASLAHRLPSSYRAFISIYSDSPPVHKHLP